MSIITEEKRFFSIDSGFSTQKFRFCLCLFLFLFVMLYTTFGIFRSKLNSFYNSRSYVRFKMLYKIKVLSIFLTRLISIKLMGEG